MELAAIATSRADEVAARWPGVEVMASAEALAARDDLDLVVIATPNDSHAPLAHAAIAAGKHVVVDKPMALDLAEARGMADAARAAGRMLAVFHNRRWDGDFLTARRVLAEGTLGRVVAWEGHFNRLRPDGLARWRGVAGPGAGLLADLGPHLVDQALTVFGRPDWVWADLADPRGAGGPDEAFLVRLGFDDVRASLAASLFVGETDRRIAVHGTAGSLVIAGTDTQERDLVAGRGPGDTGFGRFEGGAALHGPGGVHDVPVEAGRYRAFYEGVRRAMTQGAAHPVALDEALAVMEVLDAARRSDREGRRVELR
jgi:predicted dehydrogenase